MISHQGWQAYNIWEHSRTVRDLYAQRCRLEAEEMTCAAQAAELLAPHVTPGAVPGKPASTAPVYRGTVEDGWVAGTRRCGAGG